MEALALVAKASSRHSLYKGVTLYKPTSKWRAQISHGGRTVTLGDYNDEEEAARVFDRACICKYGSDAVCNFPHSDYAAEWDELLGTSMAALLGKFKEERQQRKQATGGADVPLSKDTTERARPPMHPLPRQMSAASRHRTALAVQRFKPRAHSLEVPRADAVHKRRADASVPASAGGNRAALGLLLTPPTTDSFLRNSAGKVVKLEDVPSTTTSVSMDAGMDYWALPFARLPSAASSQCGSPKLEPASPHAPPVDPTIASAVAASAAANAAARLLLAAEPVQCSRAASCELRAWDSAPEAAGSDVSEQVHLDGASGSEGGVHAASPLRLPSELPHDSSSRGDAQARASLMQRGSPSASPPRGSWAVPAAPVSHATIADVAEAPHAPGAPHTRPLGTKRPALDDEQAWWLPQQDASINARAAATAVVGAERLRELLLPPRKRLRSAAAASSAAAAPEQPQQMLLPAAAACGPEPTAASQPAITEQHALVGALLQQLLREAAAEREERERQRRVQQQQQEAAVLAAAAALGLHGPQPPISRVAEALLSLLLDAAAAKSGARTASRPVADSALVDPCLLNLLLLQQPAAAPLLDAALALRPQAPLLNLNTLPSDGTRRMLLSPDARGMCALEAGLGAVDMHAGRGSGPGSPTVVDPVQQHERLRMGDEHSVGAAGAAGAALGGAKQQQLLLQIQQLQQLQAAARQQLLLKRVVDGDGGAGRAVGVARV